jgi:aminopeptidase-like protein
MTPQAPFTTGPLPWDELTEKADQLLTELFPICRSLTGEGVRQTLRRLQEVADFELLEIPSGTEAFDWEVPPEWNIRAAYLETEDGERLIDFADCNLHVVGYSEPVDAWLTWPELEPHLHTLPDMPDAIPYRTSYYQRTWGFCLSHRRYQDLPRDGRFHAVVESSLQPGSMTIGERVLPGSSGQTFLISTYCCHPSLANDSLSGVVLWALLLAELERRPHRHSYRFVVLPETIGAIAYLARNQSAMQRIDGGYIPTTVAGPGPFGYKRSFEKDSLIDRAAVRTFAELGIDFIDYPFDINGSDEKQYSAPGFRIPIGTICKAKYYEYEAYHTSLDNLDFIDPANLVDSLKLYLSTIEKLELDLTYRSLAPYSEPMFGKRGLYPQLGGSIKQKAADVAHDHHQRSYRITLEHQIQGDSLDAMRWLMFYSDGQNSLLDIGERTGLPIRQLYETAETLRRHDLLEVVMKGQEN